MKRIWFLLSISLMLFSVSAQEIMNIRTENDNGRLIITYDLIGEDKANIIVKATKHGETIIPTAIAGDIIEVVPGLEKQIWWEPYLEQYSVEDWQIELSIWSGEYIYVQGSTIKFEDNSLVEIKGLYVGKYELTQKEWVEVMGNQPSRFEGENRPVESVRWDQAVEFCNKKSILEGLTPCYIITPDSVKCDFSADGYRLPYEAEWEYCASGGVLTNAYPYSGSKDVDDVAWYDETSNHETEPHGQLMPNELGIYDMSGNVKEWCWDNYWGDRLKPNYGLRANAINKKKVIKGGSWFETYKKSTISARSAEHGDIRDFRIGFRLFRTAVK